MKKQFVIINKGKGVLNINPSNLNKVEQPITALDALYEYVDTKDDKVLDAANTYTDNSISIVNNTITEIDDRLINLEYPDAILRRGSITLDNTTVKIPAYSFLIRINQREITNPTAYSGLINPATDGYNRIDIITINELGYFTKVTGEESLTIAVKPQPLPNTLEITSINIKGSTISAPIVTDDSKLNKGGYNGTAKDLDTEIQNLKNPDIVLKNVTPTIAGLNISAPADSFEWRINQVTFDNTPALAKTLTAASDGFYRKDVLLGTNTNTYLIIEGVEGDESVTPPTVFPTGTILLGVIDVFGATVGGFSVNDTSRTYVYGNGGETDYVEVTKLGTTLEIMQATSITGFTIPAVNLQYGKDYYLRNSTGNLLTLKSAIGVNNIRFYFPDGDFIVPVNNTIHLKYLSNGEFGGSGYFTLVGLSIKGKADKTYVDSQDLLKENKNEKGIANGYAPLNEAAKIALIYLNVVNNLIDGGTNSLLTAEQGKQLQLQVSAIQNILFSDNVNLDTVQEIVDALENVQSYIDTILVNDLTTGGTTKALTAEMGKTLKGLVDALTTIVAEKQATLVSGTNIKTVNGTTLMGSGNLVTPDMDTTTNQIVSGIKTFLAGKFGLRNIANTFTSFFTNSNTVARTYTLPNKDGTVAMTSDIPVTGYVSGGVLNYLSKYLNTTTLGYSRLFDNGDYFGIGTAKIPLKDITLGNQSNKEIGIEESSNSTVGRNLRIVAGRTINYIENAIFNKVGTVPFAAYGLASTPSGNIYIVNNSTKLYKQTGGTGAFVDTGIILPINAVSICSNSNNDLYIAGGDGDIYKQTNETGSFIATGSGNRVWAGLCSLGTVIYASVNGGDIYKQTGGTGAFVAQSQTTRAWGRMYASSTSIYVCVLSVGTYKQTNATGAFVLHSSNSSTAIVVTNSNDIFINITTDIYKQTNEMGSFIATGSAVNAGSIWGMATHANGNVYAGDYSGNVFMLQNNGSGTSNLDGGTIQLIAGTGKGTGKSKIQLLTGQKTISGTDMQVETVRAEFDENGNYKRFGTPIYSDNTTALAGGLTAGMEYRTELGVKMEVY